MLLFHIPVCYTVYINTSTSDVILKLLLDLRIPCGQMTFEGFNITLMSMNPVLRQHDVPASVSKDAQLSK